MEGPHGPHTRVFEGACAIKVSMSCYLVCPLLIYLSPPRTDQQSQVAIFGQLPSISAMAAPPSEAIRIANKELGHLMKESPVSGWDDAW